MPCCELSFYLWRSMLSGTWGFKVVATVDVGFLFKIEVKFSPLIEPVLGLRFCTLLEPYRWYIFEPSKFALEPHPSISSSLFEVAARLWLAFNFLLTYTVWASRAGKRPFVAVITSLFSICVSAKFAVSYDRILSSYPCYYRCILSPFFGET